MLDPKQLAFYTTIKNTPSDEKEEHRIEMFANNPKIEMRPLNFKSYSVDKINLDDTEYNDNYMYNNKLYENDIEKIKKELKKINE